MTECTRCNKEIGPEEQEKVWQHFTTVCAQSSMCWHCADNWEPGDEYYEGRAEKDAARADAIYDWMRDSGRLK